MHVHIVRTLDQPTTLTELLHSDVDVSFGNEVDPRSRFLVEGRPTAEQLKGPMLEALVIPYAGVPASTWTVLELRPDLRVFNLHHNAAATAEMAISLLLAVGKRIVPFDQRLRIGDWTPRFDKGHTLTVDGANIVVLGHGAIGQRVANMLHALGAKPLALSRTGRPRGRKPSWPLRPISAIDEQLPRADALILCLPETTETRGLIDRRRLARLPPHAVLVNVARAAIVDEDALFDALTNNQLAGAGLDTWYRYPPSRQQATNTLPANRPFHELTNVVMSPHRAGHSPDSHTRRMRALANLLNALATGDPLTNEVDRNLRY